MKKHIASDKSHPNDSLAAYQFANEMKPGDVVFVKKGRSLIIGRGIVDSEYIYDNSRPFYKHIRRVKWTHNGEWQHFYPAVIKTLTDITVYTEYVNKLNALFEIEDDDDIEEPDIETAALPGGPGF